MTEDAGSTYPGKPNEMKFAYLFGNVQIRMVDCPDVISQFFRDLNAVDKHNQARQFALGMEKC